MTPRLGWCCKWMSPDGDKELEARMNQRSTTVTHLRKLTRDEAFNKLTNIVFENCAVLRRQLMWIAEQPKELRLFRITSGLFPAYGIADLQWIYDDPAVRKELERQLAPIRAEADRNDIRLTTHPGPYTNLCSPNEAVVERAIQDLEYHVYFAELMGYGDTWHSSGFAINIHANTNQDPGLVQFRKNFQRVSSGGRKLITLENDEFGCSIDEVVESRIGEEVALVLDIHHHWIESAGEYITPEDPRIDHFKDSWRDLRPLSHMSTSREDLLVGECPATLPNFAHLSSKGYKPSKLRAHSDLCWNEAVNDWAIAHLTWTDIEVEAKFKNLASQQLYERVQERDMVPA